MEPRVGLAVIYRWRVKRGMEEQCRRCWEMVTRAFLTERGALGSRLHVAEDGTWVAYAQWPDRAAWERSREMPPAEGAELMREAFDESHSYPPILLEPIADYLKPAPIRPAG